jgi:protein SCO1/2
LGGASTFATADRATVQRLTEALGYRYAYDAEHDQFVHPGAAYVLRADGRVTRVLTGLGLSGGNMRLALVEAGEGRIGTFSDTVRLLCSGFDPTRGTYNVVISHVLMAAGAATILALGGLIGILVLAGRRRAN